MADDVAKQPVRKGRLDVAATGSPYWWDASPPHKTPDLPLPTAADVVVIGAGYTGLSAALTLARAGRQVVVLDANAPGSAGSTRHMGYFGGHLRASLSTLISRYGESVALDLTRCANRAFEFSHSLIETEQIECDLEDPGRITCAYRPAHYDAMAREVDLLQKMLGTGCRMLTASELRQQLGTDQYHGAELKESSLALHPGKHFSGLIDSCLASGVTIYGDTLVTSLDRLEKQVVTERGRLTGKDVLVATNAYTGDFIPELKRKLIPTGANIIVTEELDEDVIGHVFPTPRLGIDTRRIYRAFRLSPDRKRIVFAGRSSDPSRGPDHNGEILRKQMVDLFPVLQEARVSHSWGGYVGFTFDFLPHLGELDGIYYAMGFNAAGSAMAPYLGNQIALKMLGQPEAGGLLEQFDFQSRPFYSGEPWFLPWILAFYSILDRIGR